ncbi:MAG: hypothetical protein D6772_14570, partial [Bacteroidetes bacterium]
MKKPLLVFFTTCLFLLAARPAQAQFEAKVGPVALLFGGISLAGEYALSDEFGAELHAFFGGEAAFAWATAKYYLSPRMGADRFHLGVFLTTGDLGPGIGFMGGTKIVSPKNIIFDFGLGIGRGFEEEVVPYWK